jgi:molybdenum cofactor guanylyltransferase
VVQTAYPFAKAAGIVLAGGGSARMGASKAALDWHGSTLARRVTGILARSVGGPVVVVTSPGQALPALPPAIEVVPDSRPGRGPLQGLADGLAAVGDRAAVAYVSAVDVPLLHPAFVRGVLAGVDDAVDVVVPDLDGRVHPLSAAYRVSLLPLTRRLLADDERAMRALLDHARVRHLAGAELPMPHSVTNLNVPGDYQRALALRAPGVCVDGSVVPAWMLGDVLAGRTAVALNGEPVDLDPELPLVAGDVVTFRN